MTESTESNEHNWYAETNFTCEICGKCESSLHKYGKHWCGHCWFSRDEEKFP